jgi:hypothetical protein
MEKFSVALNREFHIYQTPVPVRQLVLKGNLFTHLKVVSVLDKHAEIFISALPELHVYSDLEIAVCVKKIIEESEIDFDHIQFDVLAFNMIQLKEEIHPEVIYHLESILFLLLNKPTVSVLENGLYSPTKKIEDYSQIECLKIKINPKMSPMTFSTLINDLIKINPAIRFRLDGNQSFDGEFLFKWLSLVLKTSPQLKKKIDYIEEPFKNFADMWWATKIPDYTFAIDESVLPFFKAQKLSELPKKCPWIIKPSLFGISPVIKLLKDFPEQRIIISSSFEQSNHKSILSFLASYRPQEFHGLTTVSF